MLLLLPARFGMLKVFIVNQGVASIEVEEKYERFVQELRTDRYVTVGPHELTCLASPADSFFGMADPRLLR